MKKIIISLIVLILIAVATYYLVFNNQNVQTGASRYTPDVQNKTTVSPTGVTVKIKDLLFNPGTVTVKAGTKITWINDDTIPHTVTSDNSSFLDSPVLSPGQSFNFVFSDIGTVNYHCNIHKMMKGSVVVTR